jgi:hypothetical protein
VRVPQSGFSTGHPTLAVLKCTALEYDRTLVVLKCTALEYDRTLVVLKAGEVALPRSHATHSMARPPPPV